MNKSMNKSPITTHILDTSTGKPAENVTVKLFVHTNNEWQLIAQGKTNSDGRITDWLNTNLPQRFTQRPKLPLDYKIKNTITSRYCLARLATQRTEAANYEHAK